jgi:tRNA(fMet)-specific endonuclease VapC
VNYLLDTNVCIVYMNGRSASVRDHLSRLNPDEVGVCSIVVRELYYGAMKSRDPAETLAKQRQFLAPYVSFPFDDAAAECYAELRAKLERSGSQIGGNDMLIAAIAISQKITLVTHNCREFSRVTGLVMEDWET